VINAVNVKQPLVIAKIRDLISKSPQLVEVAKKSVAECTKTFSGLVCAYHFLSSFLLFLFPDMEKYQQAILAQAQEELDRNANAQQSAVAPAASTEQQVSAAAPSAAPQEETKVEEKEALPLNPPSNPSKYDAALELAFKRAHAAVTEVSYPFSPFSLRVFCIY
jgi:hypothetical protein